jgi:hypothetical protein
MLLQTTCEARGRLRRPRFYFQRGDAAHRSEYTSKVLIDSSIKIGYTLD